MVILRNGYTKTRSVPSLFSQLASSIDNTYGQAATYNESHSELHCNTTTTPKDSRFRIYRLRRAYNILLFGTPSYEEELKIIEDRDDASSLQAVKLGDATCEDEATGVFRSLSAALFSLRRARRYDPANALEVLVDMLLSQCNVGDRWLLVRTLKLLLALSSTDSQDGEDREVIGCHGQRLLTSLYSKNPTKGSKDRLWQNEDTACRSDQSEHGNGRSNISSLILSSRILESKLGSRCQDEVPDHAPAEDCYHLENMQLSDSSSHLRYLLPSDCVLHSDSLAAARANGTGELGIDRIPWFTRSDLTSERKIPSVERTFSLGRFLSEVVDTPLSPTAWTRAWGSSSVGGQTALPLEQRTSGGSPATCFGGRADREVLRDATQRPRDDSDLPVDEFDMCGALHPSRTSMDSRSSVVRELRLTLSLPEIGESPTNLLDGVKHDPTRSTQSRALREDTGYAVGGNTQTMSDPQISPSSLHRDFTDMSTRPNTSTGRGLSGLRDYFPSGEDTRTKEDRTQTMILQPVGWELSEMRWNHPILPREALSSGSLLTREGDSSSSAFEICYQAYYGQGCDEGLPPVWTEADMVQRALAVMHGVPSQSFFFEEQRASMRVSSGHDDNQAGNRAGRGSALEELPGPSVVGSRPRIPGLSAAALSSLLEEFAEAGTWYRRLEDFAAHLLRRTSKPGQVAQAFGAELRRQLDHLEAELLGMAGEASGTGGCLVDAGARDSETAVGSAKALSLTGLLERTRKLRRQVRALAGICRLLGQDVTPEGGVVGVAEDFPRGASLLTYLYKCAEANVVSETSREGVGPGENPVLALLTRAAAPYLEMLSRWLWLGEIWPEDDPFEEFPIRCRDTRGGATQRASASSGAEAPWLQDGGNNFMTEGFSEIAGTRVSCFLDDVWTAAVRAGKLLHMLKHSSPAFYRSCAASPPPPLSLVFDARALEDRKAMFSRLGIARAVASRSAFRGMIRREAKPRRGCDGPLTENGSASDIVEDEAKAEKKGRCIHVLNTPKESVRESGNHRAVAVPVPVAALDSSPCPSGPRPSAPESGGMLSFFDPPTSEAMQQAADALHERYRLLSGAVHAREARARWLLSRRQRAAAAHRALKSLYVAEATAWKAEAVARRMPDKTAETLATRSVVACRSLGELDKEPDLAREEQEGTSRSLADPGSLDEGGTEAKVSSDACAPFDSPGATCVPRGDSVKFSHIQLTQEPGGSSAGVARALGNAKYRAPRTGSIRDVRDEEDGNVDDDSPVKFSHVTIVEEPGGKSSGVSQALGADTCKGSEHAVMEMTPRHPPYQQESVVASNNEPDAISESSVPRPTSQDPALSDPNQLFRSGERVEGGDGDGHRHRAGRKQDRFEDAAASFCAATEQRNRDARSLNEASSPKISDGGSAESGKSPELTPGHGVAIPASIGGKVRAGGRKNYRCHVPLGAVARVCLREPILEQCQAVDSAALAYLVQGAGAMGLLVSLRMFLLGLNGGFLHDFTSRLLEGLYNSVDWLRPSNLNAAFAASATNSGLESAPLFQMFRYEIDPTCGGVHGSVGTTRPSSAGDLRGVGGDHTGAGETTIRICSSGEMRRRLYSPTALSFVSPILGVRWPLGVLLPVGALRIYTNIHRALFRHHLALRRLARLRLVLRELDLALGMSVRMTVRGGEQGERGGAKRVVLSTDGIRLHWLHLFRYEMQHMADSLQSFFAEQSEAGWPELRESLMSTTVEGGDTAARRVSSGSKTGRLADLALTHSKYISDMRRNMFLGLDRLGATVRARIEQFYGVICSVCCVADGLASTHAPSGDGVPSGTRRGGAGEGSGRPEGPGRALVPDYAYAELRAMRKNFDDARKSMCEALLGVAAGGEGHRIGPLLAILGYSGVEGGPAA